MDRTNPPRFQPEIPLQELPPSYNSTSTTTTTARPDKSLLKSTLDRLSSWRSLPPTAQFIAVILLIVFGTGVCFFLFAGPIFLAGLGEAYCGYDNTYRSQLVEAGKGGGLNRPGPGNGDVIAAAAAATTSAVVPVARTF